MEREPTVEGRKRHSYQSWRSSNAQIHYECSQIPNKLCDKLNTMIN